MMAEERSNILIIDDEERIRFLLRIILEEAGYSVLTAASGQEALDRLSQLNDIKAVLLDIKMPGMSGMTVLKEVSANWPDIPVIIVTGVGDEKIATEAKRIGASDFLKKPFSSNYVLATVRKVCQKRAVQR